jgi:DNA methyltransferase 1-associated protein 1
VTKSLDVDHLLQQVRRSGCGDKKPDAARSPQWRCHLISYLKHTHTLSTQLTVRMGDIAQILGATAAAKADPLLPKPPPPPPASHNPSKAMKMNGMSREVMDLLGGNQDPASASLPPIVPAFNKDNSADFPNKEVTIKVGSKWISSSKKARAWTWAPFASSSRTDGAMFRHWVRANVEYTDYPYAKFDIHLDPVTYTDDEYARFLKSDTWTKSETDKLMEMARRFELRWAIIHDRWFGYYHSMEDNARSSRKMEELMYRYYSVAAVLAQTRISQEAAAEVQALSNALPDPASQDPKVVETILMETAAAKALATAPPQHQPLISNLGTGSSNKSFDIVHERERRAYMDVVWNRSKAEELEEMELRNELKLIDAQLRKLKKAGGHIIAASNGNPGGPKVSTTPLSSRAPSRSVSPVPGANIADSPAILDQCFTSTAPTPMPKTPYLQSGRLLPPSTGGAVGLNKSLLTRMDVVLAELKISPRPLPTKRVCDMYDSVRKDILTLLTLQKVMLQKEGNLQAKRVKLSKMVAGSDRVLDEEALLGIVKPPPPAPAPAPSTSVNRTKPPAKKSKSGSSGTSKPKSSAPKKTTPDASASSKTESKDAPAAGTAGTKTGGTKSSGEVTKKKKSAPKRKRKSEAEKAAAAAVAAASAPAGAPAPAAAPPPAPAPASTILPPAAKSVPAETGSESKGGKKRARKT